MRRHVDVLVPKLSRDVPHPAVERIRELVPCGTKIAQKLQ